MSAWVEAAAECAGVEAEHVVFGAEELSHLVTGAAPLLLRLSVTGTDMFLAVARARRRHLWAIGPDHREHRIWIAHLAQQVQQPVDAPALPDIERLLDRMTLAPEQRARARTALLMERVKLARFRGCWLLRLPTGSTLRSEGREIRLRSNLLRLMTAHFVQYGLFVLSWWLLGRGVLNGTIDRGWLLGWTLLLLSLIPFRLLATWTQGVTSTTVGAWLRRRLLRGALRIDREHLRQRGSVNISASSSKALPSNRWP
jgi:ATP-binding cassette subfamily B protein